MDSSTILAKEHHQENNQAHDGDGVDSSNGRESAATSYPYGPSGETNELHALLERVDSDLDDLSSRTVGIHLHGGPDAVALSVVREAIAIGLTMTEGDEAESYRLPLRTMDHRYLENRSRALRTALHGVDDYVWWGGITEQ